MKKNVMMRVASIMMVLVLMTSSVISGTFAKYTTQDAGSDKARVAKWGVELQVIGNLYGDSYGADDKMVVDDDTGITVQTLQANTNVVAPGTLNAEGFTFSLKGQPEVDGRITTKITTQNVYLMPGTYAIVVPVAPGVVTKANYDQFNGELYKETSTDSGVYTKASATWEDVPYFTLEDEVTLGQAYYPVVYTMTGASKNTGADYTKDTLADVVAALTKFGLSNKGTDDGITTYEGSVTFDSNTKLDTAFLADGLNLTWKWDFDWDACAKEGDSAGTLCKADTILGNLIAENTNVVKLNGTDYAAPEAADGNEAKDYCLDTQFSIDITVTQVD